MARGEYMTNEKGEKMRYGKRRPVSIAGVFLNRSEDLMTLDLDRPKTLSPVAQTEGTYHLEIF